MTRDDIIKMAKKAKLPYKYDTGRVFYLTELERFAALVAAAEREKVAAWMMGRGYATGHGDSTEDLLHELEWQIAENWRGQRSADSEIPTLDETSTLEMWLNITKRIEAAIDFHRRSVLLVERGKESSRPTPLD